MSLLIFSLNFYPERFLINEIAQAIKDHGEKVTVLTGLPNYPAGKIYKGYKKIFPYTEIWEGVEIIRIPLIPRGKGTSFSILCNFVSFMISAFIFSPFLLRGRKFKSIFVFGTSTVLQAFPAIFLSKIKSVPLVLWVQDIWPESLEITGHIKNKQVLKLVRGWVKFIYKHCQKILVSSPGMVEVIRGLAQNHPEVHYFPNLMGKVQVVKEDILNKNEKSLLQEMKKSFSVLFAGNIGKAQDWETIIKAADELKNDKKVKIYIAGAGSDALKMRKCIMNLKLTNIEMLGEISWQKIPFFYEAAEVLLVTLKMDRVLECVIPSKVQAYLRAGKPIVCCATGDAANLIDKLPAGITCKDHHTLAQSIVRLKTIDPEQRSLYGNFGKQYFQDHFALENRIHDLIHHLNITHT